MLRMLALLTVVCKCLSISGDYLDVRNSFIENEEARMVGYEIKLNDKEKEANAILMRYKLAEHDAAFKSPELFIPRRHFFEAKKDVEKSKVFQFLQKMPKGGALHGHDTTMVSIDYIYQLTYEDNLYACTIDNKLRLKFLENPQIDTTCEWALIKDLRDKNATYDEWVRSQLTLVVENPSETYPNANIIWQAMIDRIVTLEIFLSYKPIFQKCFYRIIEELYEDEVMYLEVRTTLPLLHELNGTYYNYDETIRVFQETIEQFAEAHPDFYGARLIYAARRPSEPNMTNYINRFESLQKQFPSLLVGFDIIGHEDAGRPLSDFMGELLKMDSNTNFYFHSAETNWYGTSSDFNLVDTVFLNTKRIGHGYGLMKHPLVKERLRNKSVVVEVCPISNQVLMLVDDLRNHPAATLIAEGFPIVVSYDDPTLWGVKGLSYDFYMAFMGIASRNSDLRLLKQLASNSISYSSLPESEKPVAFKRWETQWNDFIDLIVEKNNVTV